MPGLPESFRRQIEHDVAHAITFRIKALPVHAVLEGVHEEASSEDTFELPHRHQAVLLPELWIEVLAKQQHENALQEVYR